MDEGMTRPAVKPHGPWTADTERAFLIALRLTGQPKKAAAEIGRSANAAYTRRKRDAGFAARWDAAIETQQAEWIAATQARLGPGIDDVRDGAGGGRLTPDRDYDGGWDSRRRGLFLRALARTKRVDTACAAAGMSNSAAYELRARSVRFARAWEKALGGELPSVIDAVFARAVEGWDEPIVQGGQVVATRWRYSDGLLRDLLRYERGRVAGAGGGGGGSGAAGRAKPWQRPKTMDELRDSILTKLENLDRQRLEEEEAQQAAEWARWRRGWGAPACPGGETV